MDIIIRKATISDNESLFDLNKICLPIYYSLLEHFLMIISKDHIILVVEYKKEIIGYLIGKYNNKINFHVLSFGILEIHRNKGIGTFLINKLLDELKPECETVSLFVHIENELAIKFYKKKGFLEDTKIENYYRGQLNSNSQDAFKMIKKLS